jgi:hypothetical protein
VFSPFPFFVVVILPDADSKGLGLIRGGEPGGKVFFLGVIRVCTYFASQKFY